MHKYNEREEIHYNGEKGLSGTEETKDKEGNQILSRLE